MSNLTTFQRHETTLVRANAAQTKITRLNTWELWGGPKGFTKEEYLERDDKMSLEEWSVDDRFVTWVLVPRNDVDTVENILSHCETYRRSSLVLPPNSSTPTPVLSYGIACVFTPPKQHGHRYAKHMLSLLHYIMAPASDLPEWPVSEWGAKPEVAGFADAAFSVLYSGIGDKYYASCRQGSGPTSRPGWVRLLPPTRTWEVPALSDEDALDQSGWKWLDTEGVKALEPEMTKDMHKALSKEGDSTKTRLAILPEEGLLKLHCVRDILSPGAIHRASPRTYGLALPSTSSPAPAITYCFPTEKVAEQTMSICIVRQPFPLAAVFAAARREGCTKIEVWDRAGAPWEVEPGMKQTDDNMPCLAVYGDLKDDQVEWCFCERYAWC